MRKKNEINEHYTPVSPQDCILQKKGRFRKMVMVKWRGKQQYQYSLMKYLSKCFKNSLMKKLFNFSVILGTKHYLQMFQNFRENNRIGNYKCSNEPSSDNRRQLETHNFIYLDNILQFAKSHWCVIEKTTASFREDLLNIWDSFVSESEKYSGHKVSPTWIRLIIRFSNDNALNFVLIQYF